MTTTTTTTAAIRRARRALERAEAEHRATEDRIRSGDASTSTTDLADAATAVRFAQLQLEAAEQSATTHANETRARAVARYERRARANGARTRQVELESQLRAIRSGWAAGLASNLLSAGSRVTFPTTEEEFHEAHPGFAEGSDSYTPPEAA